MRGARTGTRRAFILPVRVYFLSFTKMAVVLFRTGFWAAAAVERACALAGWVCAGGDLRQDAADSKFRACTCSLRGRGGPAARVLPAVPSLTAARAVLVAAMDIWCAAMRSRDELDSVYSHDDALELMRSDEAGGAGRPTQAGVQPTGASGAPPGSYGRARASTRRCSARPMMPRCRSPIPRAMRLARARSTSTRSCYAQRKPRARYGTYRGPAWPYKCQFRRSRHKEQKSVARPGRAFIIRSMSRYEGAPFWLSSYPLRCLLMHVGNNHFCTA
jgi:hypothetical protein